MKKAGILQNPIQEYAWGSTTALAEFLGRPSHIQKPMAELWMGAHPNSPSNVIMNGQSESLVNIINENPCETLGATVASQFSSTLPYLFKVLAADQPLSIQAHPTIEQAKIGFKRENEANIPITAPTRNYKDENHKPEIICALSTFWALNGFRPIGDIIETIKSIKSPLLNVFGKSLIEQPNPQGLKCFVKKIFDLDSMNRITMIKEILNYAQFHVNHDPLFEWMITFNNLYPDDVGILTALLLNMVCLEPGDAMFLRPGQLHAYLKGFGVELMANSDNVIRGGLTPKHIDIEELLTILNFDEVPVNIIRPVSISECERIYKTSAEEFQLSVISISRDKPYLSDESRSVEIIICTQGFADFYDLSDDSMLQLTQGDSVIIPACLTQYKIEGNANLYKSSVPLIGS